jgi:leucyl-tRNA synthetase
MEYNFNKIEKKWQDYWKEKKVYRVSNESTKPKYYVLDMFPYPSGAGLHVGHPLGYIASDIYARYKKLKGYNVLHPMGFDSFGLPAEQYAIETGQHPAETTQKNITTFKSQLDKIGFCYDWEREVQTSDPNYYKWTQWIFLQLYNSYFCNSCKQAKPITELIKKYETRGGNKFTAEQWNNFSVAEKEDMLMQRRLAFSKYGEVNWCEALGTVLANDEVVNGVSERGGHPVVKKKMRQWYLRITAYADRLLEGLETVDFSESMKDMQRNWIGKSEGAEIEFEVGSQKSKVKSQKLKVYTTRPDTIFGVDFMVVAPEHEIVNEIKTAEQAAAVEEYVAYVKSRSDVDRMAEKKITGCFTGAYAINPFDGKEIPVWISEYVLAGYGTGAIMAVPCGDERDFKFAQHFNIPITNIIGAHFNGEEANPTKDAVLENSGFLNGLVMKDAIAVAVNKIEELGIGKRKVNYKMRDAGFSRQRYWGEPFPIVWNGETPSIAKDALPLELPHVDKYGPGAEGEGPLANITEWVNTPEGRRETSTMPGYAGSSWYFLRYMDPNNAETFCDRKASDYWNQVDLYIGGTEHAVGHLLYSRMWTKVLFDLGLIGFDEPFKKLLNQGMIQGVSALAKRIMVVEENKANRFLLIPNETNPKNNNEIIQFYVPVNYVEVRDNLLILTKENLVNLQAEYSQYKDWELATKINIESSWDFQAEMVDKESLINNLKQDYVTLQPLVEKMSKSKYNTFNPNDLCDKYGADTFRMYEMFLGPVEASKPWDTKGIEGVHRFLRKLWRLFYDDVKGKVWNDNTPTDAELKVLHKTIKKIEEDTDRFSFNTAVSTFMICVNELADLKCSKKAILQPLLVLLSPYAPHIAEELYFTLTGNSLIQEADEAAIYPAHNATYTAESEKEYPVSINGKVRTNITMSVKAAQEDVEQMVLSNEVVQKWLEGKAPKRIIYVPNKMVNVVV